MALDAAFLTFLTKELDSELVGLRVEKIFMPSRDETVFVMRGHKKHRLLINASTNSPRICLTQDEYEAPAVPPTFCMVMRKHFLGAKLTRVFMPDFERCVRIDFECKNDFFETVNKSVIVELMGRSANMMLVDSDNKIIDAIRRVDLSDSSGRCILPGVPYAKMAGQAGKTALTDCQSADAIFENDELLLENAIMNNISGISPIVARELAYRATGVSGMRIRQLGTGDRDRLLNLICELKENIKNGDCNPVIIKQKENGKLVDFCFMNVTQYGDFCEILPFVSPSQTVEQFFGASAKKARFEQKTKDLFNAITRLSSRITRTCAVREKELKNADDAEKYRIYGELINANLYCMQNGMTKLVCQNYYDDCKEISIPLRADRSPAQNAQLYFKKYTKAKNSAQILSELIKKDKEELVYLDSVFMALCDCETIADADGIRLELINGGYLKRTRKAQRSEKPTAPRQFEKDGYTILVGKNNMQNDFITVKMSRKNDLWLHTKNVHSSHVLIQTHGTVPPNSVIEYAATLCAYYSRAKDDLKVEVDYCPVQNVKKPVGAKPGMAVYDNYNTVIVNPYKPEN